MREELEKGLKGIKRVRVGDDGKDGRKKSEKHGTRSKVFDHGG